MMLEQVLKEKRTGWWTMSEAEEAWRLWHLLQAFADTLWERYESAFMDFCGEESGEMEDSSSRDAEDVPF